MSLEKSRGKRKTIGQIQNLNENQIIFEHFLANSLTQNHIEMAEIYKVIEFEGKGLGCVASTDIKRGSLILNENPQIKSLGETLKEARQKGQMAEWIKRLLKSFNQMNKADQLEFMTLCNIYDFQEFSLDKKRIMAEMMEIDVDLNHSIDKMIVETVKSEIEKFEKDQEKAEKILKICNIFGTNNFSDGVAGCGVAIKTARFNHSCKPNATALIMTNGQNQIRAIKDIKGGEEINICYLGGFNILRNKKFRQINLFYTWHFVCSCNLCKNEKFDSLEALVQEAEMYSKKRPTSFLSREEALISYPLQTCRLEIKCCKEIYEIGRTLKAQPIAMLSTLEQGFKAATVGYVLYKLPQFKCDAENFAKAVDKFGKILGNEIITRGQPDLWKQRYQNFEMWLLAQEVQERAQINA